MFMALIFLAMGIVTLFTDYFSTMGNLRILFGIVFLVFSCFRFYLIWKELRS